MSREGGRFARPSEMEKAHKSDMGTCHEHVRVVSMFDISGWREEKVHGVYAKKVRKILLRSVVRAERTTIKRAEWATLLDPSAKRLRGGVKRKVRDGKLGVMIKCHNGVGKQL